MLIPVYDNFPEYSQDILAPQDSLQEPIAQGIDQDYTDMAEVPSFPATLRLIALPQTREIGRQYQLVRQVSKSKLILCSRFI